MEQDGENFYIVGADSVRKKLGSGSICEFTITCTQSANSSPSSDRHYARAIGSTSMKIKVDFKNKTVSFLSHSQSGSISAQYGNDWTSSGNMTGNQSIGGVAWKE